MWHACDHCLIWQGLLDASSKEFEPLRKLVEWTASDVYLVKRRERLGEENKALKKKLEENPKTLKKYHQRIEEDFERMKEYTKTQETMTADIKKKSVTIKDLKRKL